MNNIISITEDDLRMIILWSFNHGYSLWNNRKVFTIKDFADTLAERAEEVAMNYLKFARDQEELRNAMGK